MPKLNLNPVKQQQQIRNPVLPQVKEVPLEQSKQISLQLHAKEAKEKRKPGEQYIETPPYEDTLELDDVASEPLNQSDVEIIVEESEEEEEESEDLESSHGAVDQTQLPAEEAKESLVADKAYSKRSTKRSVKDSAKKGYERQQSKPKKAGSEGSSLLNNPPK